MPAKSQGKALKSKKHSANDSPVQPPAWPPLQPLVPSEDLALKTVLDEQIIVIPNLLTSMLCKRYVSFLSSLPLITTPVQPKAGEAVRVNDRVQYDDSAFAERLWSSTALKDLISGSKKESEDAGRLTPEMAKQLWGGEVVGLNPRIRVYRYGNDSLLCHQSSRLILTMLQYLDSFLANTVSFMFSFPMLLSLNPAFIQHRLALSCPLLSPAFRNVVEAQRTHIRTLSKSAR